MSEKANRFIEQYLATYQNYKTYWNYEDGCVVMGAKYLYEATGDEMYFQFIEKYLKHFIL